LVSASPDLINDGRPHHVVESFRILQVESEIASSLAEDTFLDDDLLRQLMGVGEVDLIVGISSHTNATTTSQAFRAIERSFQQHFTRQRAVIVNACGGDQDKSDAAVAGFSNVPEKNVRLAESVSLRTVQRVTADFSVPPSPGMALRTILAAADLLQARACAVVSPGTTNLTPDWIANLLRPAYQEKFDFVAPLYSRHKFQGLLARNLLYPMSRAIFGCGIRELYSDEWGFSGRLAADCLKQDVWHEEHIGTRPEAWMAISAISSDFRCCQVFLGQKVQSTIGSGTDIVEVFRQTVGSLFWCMESQQSEWLDGERLEPVQTFGPDHEITSEPSELNRHRIFEMFRSGVSELEPILSSILDPETHAEIKGIVSLEEGKFRFRSDLWVRTLYDFAASYHHAVINRDHLVQALAPLYRGMTFSYLVEHSDSSPAEMEAVSEALCVEFEHQKPYLREKWKTKVEVKS
jgi:glucosylglycerate synthase